MINKDKLSYLKFRKIIRYVEKPMLFMSSYSLSQSWHQSDLVYYYYTNTLSHYYILTIISLHLIACTVPPYISALNCTASTFLATMALCKLFRTVSNRQDTLGFWKLWEEGERSESLMAMHAGTVWCDSAPHQVSATILLLFHDLQHW
jgi:hypothetical protein